jgi:hypothetical protein
LIHEVKINQNPKGTLDNQINKKEMWLMPASTALEGSIAPNGT